MSEILSWVDDEAIPGMFDFAEVYDLAVKEAPWGSYLVEVGVFHGRSLVYLARAAAKANNFLQVVGVDWGRGIGYGLNADGVLRNLLLRKLDVPLIFCDSAKAANFFKDNGCFFVFLDADHEEESVRRDINAWLPKIAPGGILAGHDYEHPKAVKLHPGVKVAVDDILGPEVGHKPIKGCWMMRKHGDRLRHLR